LSRFNRKRVEDWLDFIENGDAIAILWSVNDIMSILEHNGMEVSRDQAQQILRLMQDSHDAELGITWDTVLFWGKEVLDS
jgi:hypothetical protein